MQRPTLALRTERIEDSARLIAAGEIDLVTADSLTAQALSALEHPAPRTLTLDLAGVTFCASTGLTALVTIYQRAAQLDVALGLANVPDQIAHILNLTGIAELFPDHTTMAAAGTQHEPPPTAPAS